MTRGRKWVMALVGLGALALVAWPVYAHCGKCAASCKDMVKAMDAGKMTLNKAIEAAEAHAKGKACAAVSHMDDGKLHFAVYCLVGDKLSEVEVDAAGKAAKMQDAKFLPSAEHEGHDAEKPAEKKEGKPGAGQ